MKRNTAKLKNPGIGARMLVQNSNGTEQSKAKKNI